MSVWLSWNELNLRCKEKSKIYLYGRSEDWVHKAIKKITANIHGIVDRDITYHGTEYFGLPISPIEKIDCSDSPFFIITAGEFEGIVDTLENMGLKSGVDFCCSPDFRDYRKIKDFHEKNFEVLIASSDYNDQTRARSSRVGGGLFKFNTATKEFTKLVKGSFRQFEYYNGFIVAVDYVERELVFINSDYVVEKRISLPKPNYCGLAIDEVNNTVYIANAGDDSILVINEPLSLNLTITELNFLSREGSNREAHINDLELYDGKLLFSYFSKSGNYKLGVFDGGVSHYDLQSDELATECISGLWKPHSPKVIGGKLWVLDSMRGSLVSGFGNECYNIGGFARGLDEYQGVMVVGQSQDMYLSDRVSQGSVVSVDSGIHLFDTDSKAVRFIPINTIMNIHDIKVITHV
ncbi:DUF4915 domain-containing protein [Aliamphritea hakodatensis]|uniref:DUF4915 domain-containing protein n=1 Tax=Aliamphritea hakodatensis TaxID=2895352 RepID=UPI0022FD4E51|nr:DUF4915 domain-containing protein [Aliamphritea hakodatensis]